MSELAKARGEIETQAAQLHKAGEVSVQLKQVAESVIQDARQDFGPSGDYLLRNDWLSRLIGALLCLLGCGRGAPRDHALPGGLLGGAEVVRRMASHEPQRIP